MHSAFVAFTVIAGLVEARFNQEPIPIPAIAAVQGGDPGEAQTIAGAAVSDLLAGANACAKLQRADQIITELGTGADAIAAAIGMIIPTICNDPGLPATDILRGITPLIDPAVAGSDVANALSARTRKNPLDATGKSIADPLAENGFTNFTTQGVDGATAADSTATTAAASPTAAATQAQACQAQTTARLVASSAASGDSNASGGAAEKSTIAGLDFGKCVPTMKFEGRLGGRPGTEFTFQAIDPLVAEGQQEALNPNIITNRICDQLVNVCEANAAAINACDAAQAEIEALGSRDKSTADAWNTALGFEGTITNPDGGPAEPPAASTAARVRVRRGQRVHKRY